MSILEILKYPDPFLRTTAEEVEAVDDGVRGLIDNMTATMYAASGIGLAAVQVGVAKRVVVLDVPSGDDHERGQNLVALVNPRITSSAGTNRYEEGCLSVPGITADVTRAETVTVESLDCDGREIVIEASGLFATALQHELDHLDGILFIDRLSRLKRDLVKRRLKKALAQERAL
jgi:peptide deformylase